VLISTSSGQLQSRHEYKQQQWDNAGKKWTKISVGLQTEWAAETRLAAGASVHGKVRRYVPSTNPRPTVLRTEGQHLATKHPSDDAWYPATANLIFPINYLNDISHLEKNMLWQRAANCLSVLRFLWIMKLTSWTWALLETPPVVQLLEDFPALYGTRRFISVLTRFLHWSLCWARSIQSIPSHPISLKIHFNIVHPPTSWSS
jgi:hypothetical protein